MEGNGNLSYQLREIIREVSPSIRQHAESTISQRHSEPRIFVRSSARKLYLGSQNEWCEEIARAYSFSSALEAELHCRSYDLRDVELVVLRNGKLPLVVTLTVP